MENYLIFIILCITYCCNLSLAQQIQTSNSDDQSALLTLKSKITSDPTNLLSNWSSNASVCSWAGVSCTSNKRVMTLNLSSSSLEGNIPPHLGNLRFLISLDLSFNHFNGFIPTELGSLQLLNFLNLAHNNFTGKVPPSIGNLDQLQHLLLQHNNLTGTIPVSLGNLTKLNNLNLAYNFLEGTIPQELQFLSNLKILSLEGNGFGGRFPNGIFKNMTSLQEISLADNGFSGSIPADICNHLPNLIALEMSFNQFEGPIPPEIYKCKSLEIVSLSYNRFNTIPKEIGYLINLKDLFIERNIFTTGGIPSEIGNLTQLRRLDIGSSLLNGQIPPSIFNISSLTLLNLSNNTLSGTLPTFPLSNLNSLQVLQLSTNELTGHIPSFLFQCNSLQILALHENSFIGQIPQQVGNLTSLQVLFLGFNNLTGNLPEQIGTLGSLQQLDVTDNFLKGSIPPDIFNMTSLIYMALSGSNFSGRLPSTMWTTLPNIESVYLSDNNFTGTIPSSIGNATNLSILAIEDTSLTGTIPTTIGDLEFLRLLFLGSNNLTGESWTQELRFITALTRCRNLQHVELSLNQFNGYLPNSFGNFSSSLTMFNIFNSKLIGRIPSQIGNLSSLESINMDSNEFTGFIPSTIGKMTHLDRIYLEHNKLQGSIPNELCDLVNLGDLYLNENMLSGSIPDCLGKISAMRRLYLHSNNLSSTIPMSIWNLNYLLDLNLSLNAFTGLLPLEIQNLKVITAFDLSWNQLSGNIPSTIGSSQSLVRLSLAHNQFEGNIPQSFGKLLSLEALDLSDNRFSGMIPTSLEDLKYLTFFNVSSNQLQGQIPTGGPFSNFTVESFLDNYALCGSDRMHFPLCQSNKHRGSRLKVLRIIFPPVASAILIAAAFAYLSLRLKKKHVEVPENEIPLPCNLKTTSYCELLKATDSFSESCHLGTGSFGSVYKATLADGSLVAVKVFHMQSEASEKSFDAECTVLASIRHRNLVKILSFCKDLGFKALILDYIPDGNLDMWLHSDKNLDLVERLNIAIDVAAGLEYLHHDHVPAIVHCDLKPSNILLNENKTAHLCDFGISKLLDEGVSMAQTKTLATIGYMAPEYGANGMISTCGDVYSYGVILLEMFTNKSPTDDIFVEGLNLKSLVAKSIMQNSIMEVVDKHLITNGSDGFNFSAKKDCFDSLLQLAIECLHDFPQKRIKMRKVTVRIHNIKAKLLLSGESSLKS